MSTVEFDELFDFVIVGSGGGSMCAGLVMRALGQSVVILEKTDLLGGTTARSGGVMWIPNNRYMRADGISDSYDRAMEYLDATAGQSVDAPGTSRDKRAAYLTEGPRMIDFLALQGIRMRRAPYWPDYYDDRLGGSVPGRTVIADLFDVNELGEWQHRLRPNFMTVPAYHAEGFEIATMKSSFNGRLAMARVGARMALARLTGKRLVAAGGALQGRMLKASLHAGVDLRVNSGVKSFIMDGDRVAGVVIKGGDEVGGRDWRIGATNGVLVNAGGFAHNQAMRDQYMPLTSARWTGAAPGDTGEMIRELMALGAASGQMDECVGNQMSIPPGNDSHDGEGVALDTISGQMNFAKPHSIVVDQSGVRYMNEGGSYMAFCQNMILRHETVPAVPSWWVLDEQYMRKYMFGATRAATVKPPEWYDSGYLKRADTIAELARLIAVDPAVLQATIDRFNAGARAGRDDDYQRGHRAYDEWLGDRYHRPSHTLGPISDAPFYAAKVVPGDVGTFGGVVTDAHARVLRADGTPIPGLYATGTTTASVMGRCYPGAGSSIGPSFVFGYIAAKHAANGAAL